MFLPDDDGFAVYVVGTDHARHTCSSATRVTRIAAASSPEQGTRPADDSCQRVFGSLARREFVECSRPRSQLSLSRARRSPRCRFLLGVVICASLFSGCGLQRGGIASGVQFFSEAEPWSAATEIDPLEPVRPFASLRLLHAGPCEGRGSACCSNRLRCSGRFAVIVPFRPHVSGPSLRRLTNGDRTIDWAADAGASSSARRDTARRGVPKFRFASRNSCRSIRISRNIFAAHRRLFGALLTDPRRNGVRRERAGREIGRRDSR